MKQIVASVDAIDQAARLLLEQFVSVDQREQSIVFKIGSFLEHKSAVICRDFVDGRHLEALKRAVEANSLNRVLPDGELLVLAIDEADKCPIPLARTIRCVLTHTQHEGMSRVRFAVAGVSPFFQQMVNEDPGMNRFFYKTIDLAPMGADEARELLQIKFALVSEDAFQKDITLEVDPDVLERVTALSGGHPHLLQLLGSHLVEHENDDPDGRIDARDLANSLRRICYEDRSRVYDSTLHMLDLEDKLDAVNELLELAATGFPTRIDSTTASDAVGTDVLHWLVDHNILSRPSESHYGLIDEFLRVRLLLDEAMAEASPEKQRRIQAQMEAEIVDSVSVEEYAESEVLYHDFDEVNEREIARFSDEGDEADKDLERDSDY